MKLLQLAGVSLVVGVAALSLNPSASAQQGGAAAPAPAAAPAARQLTLDQVLSAVR